MFARLVFCAAFVLNSVAWCASGLTYSTYLRDGLTPSAVVTDTAGNVFLAGSTIIDQATSQTAAMVIKLDPAGAHYLFVKEPSPV